LQTTEADARAHPAHAILPRISTQALKGDDATYAALESKLVDLTNRRNEIAGQMIAILDNAAFNGQEVDEGAARHLIDEANDLLASVGSFD
jgi:hypothetical protein